MAGRILNSSLNNHAFLYATAFRNNFCSTSALQPHKLIGLPFHRYYSSLIRRGEIYIVAPKVTFESGAVADSKEGSRPGVVVSTDLAIKETGSVMMARLSGSEPKYKYEVRIPSDKTTGLNKPSKLMTNQIFTVALSTITRSRKLGVVATEQMQQIDRELKTAFSPLIKLSNASPKFSRGDIVTIPTGKGNLGVLGVVVSNDLGNQMSEIIMMSHSSIDNRVRNQFEVKVNAKWVPGNREEERDLIVCCNEIDTVDQQKIKKIGKLSEQDLESINAILFYALGIKN